MLKNLLRLSALALLFTMSAGAGEFRWSFDHSADASAGDEKIPPATPPTLADGALDTAAGPVRYRLSAEPSAAGMLAFRFDLKNPPEKGREYCLLDMMEGGNGLRLWIDRTGQFACDLREGWQARFWWAMPADKLGVGRWNDFSLTWSADKLVIMLDGRRVFEKAKPTLPKQWGRGVTFGAFSDGKAPVALRVAALTLSDRAEAAAATADRRVGTFVQPTARNVAPVFGLNIHTRDSDRELPVIERSGVGRVRFHFTWNEAEAEKGKLALPPSAFAFMKSLAAHRLEPLMILAYGNKHYSAPGSPGGFDELKKQNTVFHAGFGRYARYMAETFGARGNGQVKEWEIWNEQNGATPEEYLPVLRAASENIRQADPAAVVVFGGISRMDRAFVKRCFELGAGELVDAVAVHPYREEVQPEAAYQPYRFDGKAANYAEEVALLREVVDRHALPGKTIPLWITEFGYWTVDSQPSLKQQTAVSHDVQAKYLLRSMLQNLALGIDRYYIYRAVDSAFFGLTYGPDYLPRSGYFALQHLNKLLPRGVELEVLATPVAVHIDEKNGKLLESAIGPFDPHAYLFRKADGTLLLALWNGARATDRQVEVPVVDLELPLALKPGKVGVHDLFLGSDRAWYTGRPVTAEVSSADGKSQITQVKFYDSPVILELGVP